jgi:hypothetical protein
MFIVIEKGNVDTKRQFFIHTSTVTSAADEKSIPVYEFISNVEFVTILNNNAS